MALSLWDVTGDCDGYQIHASRAGDDGGSATSSAAPVPNPLDVHPRTYPLLADTSVPLWIAEGSLSATPSFRRAP